MPGHNQHSNALNEAQPLLRELWQTRAWRLFPLLLIYMSGLTLLVPHIPGIMTDYFAQRRAGHELRCEGLPAAATAVDTAACRVTGRFLDAPTDVVLWSSWTSFFSNTVVSIVLTPLLGHWSDLYGRKPFFFFSQACSFIPLTIVLLYLTLGMPLMWYYVVQVFISSLSSITVSLAFIADLMAPSNRATAFGLIMAIFSVAIFVGPAAGAAMAPITAALCALCTVGICATYTLVLLPESLSPEAKAAACLRHANQQHRHQDAADGAASLDAAGSGGRVLALSTLRTARILLRSPLFKRLTLCMMLTGIVSEGLQDLLVQYLKLKMDFDVADVSHIFMTFGVCGLLVQTVVLRSLLTWLGEQRVLVLSLGASAVQELILAAAGTKWVALVGIGLGSLGSMSLPTISSIKSINAQEHEQGSVQGALYGARALASGTGTLIFAVLFSLFTRTDSPLPCFPGVPFVFGFFLMLVAMAAATTIPSTAGGSGGSIERRLVPVRSQRQGGSGSDGSTGEGETLLRKGVAQDAAAAEPATAGEMTWLAGELVEAAVGPSSRHSHDLEGGRASAETAAVAGNGSAAPERGRLQQLLS